MNLLIHRDGQQHGPYTLEQARALVDQGQFSLNDLAWPDGATEWVPLEQALKPTSKPARKRSPGRIFLLALVGIFLAFIAMWGFWRISLASKINSRLAAIKAAGYPSNPAELDAWYSAVPEEENAALVLLQATNLLAGRNLSQDAENFRRLKLLPRTAPLPPEVSKSFTAELQQVAAALPLLHQVAKLKNSRYPVDFAKGGILTQLPHLPAVKDAASLLRKEALLAADGLRPGVTASDSLMSCLAVGRTLKSEPTIISQLVRQSVDYMVIEALERALNRAAFSDAQLTSLAAALDEADDPNTWTRALAGERAGAIPFFRMSRADAARLAEASDSSGVPLKGGPPAMRFTGFFERDLHFYLWAMETNVAMLNLPAPQSLMATNVSEALNLQARRKFHILSALLLPSYGRLSSKAADHSARFRVAETALAIERFRLAHQNQLPASLAALVPAHLQAVPTDPWDGQPLRFKRLPKGYVVYSVGPDGQDDGGAEQVTDSKGKKVPGPFDITFPVER